MAVPFSYSIRNLWKRRLTTVLTVSGLALVVFVFAAVLMMAAGLQKTLVDTGSADNVVVVRKGSTSEVMSGIERNQASIVEMLPQVAMSADGQRLVAKESVVLIALQKHGTEKTSSHSNVIVRGVQAQSLPLRSQVKIASGRMFKMGSSEVIVGNSIAKGFQGVGLQGTLSWGMRTWTVVGIFDAGNTGFSSEIWGDVDQVMQAFRRPVYSSLIFKLQDPADFVQAKKAIETDPRLKLEAKRETKSLKYRLAKMTESRDRWKAEARCLRESHLPMPPSAERKTKKRGEYDSCGGRGQPARLGIAAAR